MELLIVGTLDGQIGAASKIAIAQGGHVSLADKIESALEILRSGKTVELVMIDVRLDVHKFISSLEAERINVLVVAAGVSNDPALAVNAIKAGAREYIPLPPDPELIGAVLAAATRENHALIYGDKKTEQVLKLAKQIAPSEANVLLTGESGTGKEIFSRFIHDNSKRANKKFVAVNCAAIPETLLESELFGYEKGAFTGEISTGMLKELQVGYVVIGHSERRQYFGETDEVVAKRSLAAITAGITPIICVGETLEQRQNGTTFEIVKKQTEAALDLMSAAQVSASVIAYEPVWAIGTGLTATKEQAEEVIAFIRSVVAKKFDSAAADALRIQYGGSMNAKNAAELMAMPNIDGGLIGGASLKAPDFAAIVEAASKEA